ncbi:MAG: hypothetical protein JNK57_15475 [Planctomycetaceae bacterium]|nr:hypothetical protein [Planctomycetaceae bacterium]
MVAKKETIERHQSAQTAEVSAVGWQLKISTAVPRLRWIANQLVRWAAMSAIFLGLFGSRAGVPELVTGEVIETVEVVVSINWRHHESETFSASDREFTRRKCLRHRGRNSNIVRCCCRHLSREYRRPYLSVGHRLPDNSLAPLLI